jgi:hypothetical protein
MAPAPDDPTPSDPVEQAVLDAFERLAPQGDLRWNVADALRRLEEPHRSTVSGAAPWTGLPDGVWERGRAAQAGRRLMGDVTEAVATLLAEDARRVADAATGVGDDRFTAVADAFRYLVARVERLEARCDPAALASLAVPVADPDPTAWSGELAGWLAGGRGPVVVGELGAHGLLAAAAAAGHGTVGVDPRGEVVRAATGADTLVLGEVVDELGRRPAGSVAGVVLAGCVDRADLAGKVALLDGADRVAGPDGTVVLLVAEPAGWDDGLDVTARDLLPGRPLHPETWDLLVRRRTGRAVAVHRAAGGPVHAVVAGPVDGSGRGVER